MLCALSLVMDLFVKFVIVFVVIYAVVGRVQVHSDHYVLLLFPPGVHTVFEMRSRFISRRYTGMSGGHFRPVYRI